MRDLIRSPLQFVRPMTEQEWQAMMLRAAQRELSRKLRKRAQPKATLITKRRLELVRVAQATDSTSVF